MKIGIYNAPGGEGVGGAELCVVVLAEALARDHDVEIVHHKRSVDREKLSAMFSVDLQRSRLRYVPQEWRPYAVTGNPIRRYRDAVAWQSALSAPYDLFFIFTHDVPPFCHALKGGVLVVLFAAHTREDIVMFKNDRSKVLKYLKRLYHEFEWRGRMRSYRHKLAISEFTRAWVKRRWRVDCQIFHPPGGASIDASATLKEPVILSVGRFTTHGHSKRQREMMNVYRELVDERARGWQYVCAGGLTNLADDRIYFDEVRASGATCGAHVEANLTRSALTRLFDSASIFWHASGFGIDETAHPEAVEHYGISTVEAMAAGCIPVVINRGGQREIVEHGESGFLWNTLDELRDFTKRLASDEELRHRMSRAARTRAVHFSRDAFVEKAQRIVDAFLANRRAS